MNKKPVSLHDFKNWLANQKGLGEFFNISRESEDPNDKYIGGTVRSKVGEKKLLEKVETEGDAEIVIAEFLEEGGTILSVDEKRVQIEVDSGSFFLPRFCVKLCKD